MYTCMFNKLDTSLGTLWWVRENIWAENIPNYGRSDRKLHPGLSVNEAKAFENSQYVPLLHGTSKNHASCLTVRDLDEKKSVTFFGHIRPVKIGSSLFTLYSDDPGWTRRAAVVRNHHKPWITDGEEEQLLKWLRALCERQPWWKHQNP